MTLTKAIKELEWLIDSPDLMVSTQIEEALKLGIEALKRLQLCRSKYEIYSAALLPGETND